VRIAPESSNEVREIEANSRARPAAESAAPRTSRFAQRAAQQASSSSSPSPGFSWAPGRFTLPLNGDEHAARVADEADEEEEEELGAPIEAAAPVMRGVRERVPGGAGAAAQPKAPGESRFAAMRRLNAEGGTSGSKPTGFPAVSHRDTSSGTSSSATDASTSTQWLDEDGLPMSAFRRARLQAAGKGPPAQKAASVAKPAAPAATSSSSAPSTSALPGQDMATSQLMRDADAENERKVQRMDAAQVESELEELKAHFGAEMLELLRGRKADTQKTVSQAPELPLPQEPSPAPQPSASAGPSRAKAAPASSDAATPADIHSRYFPDEPAAPSGLQWMLDQTAGAANPAPEPGSTTRFDFEGRVVRRGEARPGEGLHHHGADADAAGYTAAELLHLARSTVPAQRVSALNTLQRVLETHAQLLGMPAEADPVASALDAAHVRQRLALTAVWLLRDRQRSVRLAALLALRAALASAARGPAPFAAVEAPHLPAPVREETFEVAVKRDIVDGTLRAGLTSALTIALAEAPELCDVAVDVLYLVASHSPFAAHAATSEAGLLEALGEHALRARGERANARALDVLLLCASADVASARRVATGPASQLLRYVAMPPWLLDESTTAHAWLLLTGTLRLHATLARYGLGAPLLASAWSNIAALFTWATARAAQAMQMQQHEADFVAALMQLAAAWTTCAADPHSTTPAHAVQWAQVETWGETALEVLTALARSVASGTSRDWLASAGQAACLLRIWLAAAQKKDETARARHLSALASSTNSLATISEAVCAALQEASSCNAAQPFWRHGQARALRLARAASAGTEVARLCIAAQLEAPPVLAEAAQRLLRSGVWHELDHEGALATGSAGVRQTLVCFCAAAGLGERSDKTVSPAILSLLRPGDEQTALQIVEQYLALDDAQVLRPFMAESLRIPLNAQGLPHYAPEVGSQGAIARTATLFLALPPQPPSEDEELAVEGSEDEPQTRKQNAHDVDPISGARLWRSATSGLPLRRDWTLQALDDLLHSGDCAALNRPKALPEAWDANERQLVQATLELTLRSTTRAMQSAAGESGTVAASLPSASEILLGICKVFLLEADTTPNPRASGAATGRDLFRDATIAPLLDDLFALSRQLAQLPSARVDSLEQAAQRDGAPFYQLYTDLLGLYDSISFGDARFGKALLAPLPMSYAPDYRKLLWGDYAHLLPTLRIALDEAPCESALGFAAYLEPRETDTDMLRRYAAALLGGRLTPQGSPLLHRIATHHLAAALWTAPDGHPDAVLARRLFSGAPSGAAVQLRELLVRYDVQAARTEEEPTAQSPSVPQEIVRQREEALTRALAA
jgi:hypothetical protein